MSDVIVLCYHAISVGWPAALAVQPERLSEQLELIVRRGYRGATFSQALESPPGRKTLVVTFDDAFASVFDKALPILSSLRLPGTVFAVTDFADSGRSLAWAGIDHWRGGPYEAELAGLGWQQLLALADAGWEIGSHTSTHPRLTELDDAALATELGRSRAACERAIGRPCSSIAYPYGDVDRRVTAAAAAAGYRHGAALPASRHRPRPLEWPRIGVYNGDDRRRFALKVSRALRAARLVTGR
jgi:peptidoglycan/xylan/chitin deacetylase (PgdA/CDA1 family)